MANTDDIQRYGRKLQNQLEKLTEADPTEADCRAIRQFIDYLDVGGDNNQRTIVSNLNQFCLAADEARHH
jgi:hypothetical protein